jgi:hypothetical protein
MVSAYGSKGVRRTANNNAVQPTSWKDGNIKTPLNIQDFLIEETSSVVANTNSYPKKVVESH